MFKKLINLFELSKVNLVRLMLAILFRKKSKPFVLKYLEMKLNIITLDEFQGWVILDAQEL